MAQDKTCSPRSRAFTAEAPTIAADVSALSDGLNAHYSYSIYNAWGFHNPPCPGDTEAFGWVAVVACSKDLRLRWPCDSGLAWNVCQVQVVAFTSYASCTQEAADNGIDLMLSYCMSRHHSSSILPNSSTLMSNLIAMSKE